MDYLQKFARFNIQKRYFSNNPPQKQKTINSKWKLPNFLPLELFEPDNTGILNNQY